MAPRSVFAVDRDLWDDSDFSDEPFTEREAWIWLLSKTAWKDGPVRGNTGNTVELKRAEFSIAIRYMAERWKWSKSRVDRFLQTLEKRDAIRDRYNNAAKVYFVKNYNVFQVVGIPKIAESGTDVGKEVGQQRDKEETSKHLKKKERGARKGAPVIPGLEFPIWWPIKEWSAFVEMRRKIKKPLTDHAVELAIGRLTDLRAQGENPVEVLNKAIFGAYQGLYGRNDNRRGVAPTPPAPVEDTGVWLWRLEAFHHGNEEDEIAKGYWQAKWGPAPGQAGCLATEAALKAYASRHGPRLAQA